MITYPVREAWKAYKEGRIEEALALFYDAAQQIGIDNFKINIQLLKKIRRENQSIPCSRRTSTIRVAAIMDSFTAACYSPECDLLQLRPNQWKEQIENFHPDFIFIESAWKGIDDLWDLKVSRPDAEISELFSWCRIKGIPTIFWNKEDPVHFQRFLHIAKQADFVFTVDYDKIAAYKGELNHNNVFFLPFAAQPSVHNPIEKYARKDAFCFAGSWYPQYPKRQEDFIHLSNVAKKFRDIEIYDRNLGNEKFAFPSSLQAHIKGSLPYSDIDRAYKEYRYGINVNTVKHSSTMFARRVYELLASNTVVLSNYARGIKTLLGDLVLTSDNEDFLLSLLKRYTENEQNYRRFRLLGLRKVMRAHTYADRLNYICQVLGLHTHNPEMEVALLAYVQNPEEKNYILSIFERQTWKNLKLFLLQNFVDNTQSQNNITIFQNSEELWENIKNENNSVFFALLDPNDYYSDHYIEDMALARHYSTADAFGKASYYSIQGDSLQLLHDGSQYRPIDSKRLAASRALVSRAIVTEKWLCSALYDPCLGIPENASCLALDEFSYIQSGAKASDTYKNIVSDIIVHDQGMSLSSITRSSKTVQPIRKDNAETFSLSGAKLHTLLPSIDGITRKTEDSSLILNADLEISRKYIYAKKIFTLSELNLTSNYLLKLDGEGLLDVRFVLIFLNKNKEKISHIILSNSEKKELHIPHECFFVKIGIRISGNGSYALRQVKTEDRATGVPLLRNSCLIVAKHYPAYEDIYRYGFVHSRLRAYKEHGTNVDFFEFSTQGELSYREFEGINILCGSLTFLDALLASGQVTCLCVHILERPLWEVIKKYLRKIKIIIWCHGAEIQLWHRRAFEFFIMDQGSISKAKEASDIRFKLWQEVFQQYAHLHFVFVSQYFKDEVCEDFNFPHDSNYSIIHNFIDPQVFPYREKKPKDRLKLISVSTYASQKYANDLTTKAIYILQKKPYFNELEFSIYGDGKLFDGTVSSLAHLKNVFIYKTFLTHAQLAQVYSQHGIIVVPTRWDSQGVTRDEAMSSGLVPVTTRVAAVPEFTDSDCAFVVEPESAEALAEAIDTLYYNPDLYLAMSKKAAARPRWQCSYEKTIARELQLMYAPSRAEKMQSLNNIEFLVYSDTNPNIFDGSSIWLTSVLSILARDHKVATLLKANITAEKHVLQTVEHKENIVFLEPQEMSLRGPLSPATAAHILAGFEHLCPNIRGVVIRGYEIADILIQEEAYQNKLLPYLSAFYRPGDEKGFAIPPQIRPMVRRLLTHGRKALIQTPFLAEEYEQFLGKPFSWSLLPPAIPDDIESSLHEVQQEQGIVHIGYGGKIYPRWGVEELILWTEELVRRGLKICVHIAIAKMYNDAEFIQHMKTLLALPHVKVYKGLDRTETMSLMRSMDYAWCWREATFEETTLEISMKLIENAALGVPCICYPSRVNIHVFGKKYGFFCKDKNDVLNLLQKNIINDDSYIISTTNLSQFKYSMIKIV